MLQIFPNLENVFEEASVDTLIIIASKSKAFGKVSINSFEKNQPITKHKIDATRFMKNNRIIFDVELNEESYTIIEKINRRSFFLADISEITRGVNPYDKYRGQSEDIIKNKVYHANYKKDETFLPELRGKHINSYGYKWDGKHYISYGAWLAAPRDMKYFEGPRIIMRQVLGTKLNCTIIKEDYIIDQSVFISKPFTDYVKHLNLIQGILASKLISFYFRFTNNEFDALFPKIKIGEFRELPVYKELDKVNNTISELVNEVLSIKKQIPLADTTSLESEIDQLVYALYELTEEEIEIVENT